MAKRTQFNEKCIAHCDIFVAGETKGLLAGLVSRPVKNEKEKSSMKVLRCMAAVTALLLVAGSQVGAQTLADALDYTTYEIGNWDYNADGGTGNWTWDATSTWTDANGDPIAAPINAPGSMVSVEPRVLNTNTTITIAQDITIGHLTARTAGDGGRNVRFEGDGVVTFDTGDGSTSLYTSYRTDTNWDLGVNQPHMTNDVILNNDLRVIKNISNTGGGLNADIIGSASGTGKLWIEIGSRDSAGNSILALNQTSYHSGGTEISPMLATYGNRTIPHANMNINATGAFGTGPVTIRDDNAALVGGSGDFRVAFLADQLMAQNETLYLYTTGDNLRLTLGAGTGTTVSGLFIDGTEVEGSAENPTVLSGGSYTWMLGDGTLTVIPEPGTIGLLGLAGLALLLRRRFRKIA